jgi:hypothetical protein
MGFRTVADERVLRSLEARLAAVTPRSERQWGTLTPHEMLCHLGDAADMVLGLRPRTKPLAPESRWLKKLVGIWLPIPWRHGVPTNPQFNPHAQGTRPTDFDADRSRVVAGLRAIAGATEGLEPMHGMFGAMSLRDWQRWAFRHTDHHLRQFGV